MSAVNDLIEGAFDRLAQRPGFTSRPYQRQLSLLLADLIGTDNTGAFEAPTGLGKSLAALIPAIAHAIVSQKRTVIATYTNVLAEQYWRTDLPLALSLFDDADDVKAEFLIGRQRYACLIAMDEHAPGEVDRFRASAELGIETEFRRLVRKPARELSMLWPRISTPPVCAGRLCPAYHDCFYYNARRRAEQAHVILTNHSVVISDAVMAAHSDDGSSMLGKFDFLILDEAHDFPLAAQNGLEFELSAPKLSALAGIATRLETSLRTAADAAGAGTAWARHCQGFRDAVDAAQRAIAGYSLTLGRPGILTAAPTEVLEHPQVKNYRTPDDMRGAKEIAAQVAEACDAFNVQTLRFLEDWKDRVPELTRAATETTRNYLMFFREYGAGCTRIFTPQGVSVSYVGRTGTDAILRQDIIDLAEPLQEFIWNRVPYALISATLATDGNFDFIRRTTGAQPAFEEVLPTPFDFGSQAAIYLPPSDAIPDPTVARREGREDAYYACLARELTQIITAVGGRTLALFHSRKEMEGVMALMNLPPDLPILVQPRSGAGATGERFLQDVRSSLFALRSFWTGFDAPGETLSCVALVRVPFEVPIDPPQVARLAYLQTQGVDAFAAHTLPMAKMLMRQGAGRLIRRSSDKGIIALLDSRLQSKRYGEEIIANLPPDMRTFRDIRDAVGWIGLPEDPVVASF